MRRLVQWIAALGPSGWLQWSAVGAGMLSGIFWVMSATVTVPVQQMFYAGGGGPSVVPSVVPPDPYYIALHAVAWWNTGAAVFAAVAAFAQAIALGLSARR